MKPKNQNYMNTLAEWANYKTMMYHTGKLSYFKHVGPDDYLFISHVKDYDPRINRDQFIDLLNVAVDRGVKITIEKKRNKIKKYMNVSGTCELDGRIGSAQSIDFQRAFVNSLKHIVKNITG